MRHPSWNADRTEYTLLAVWKKRHFRRIMEFHESQGRYGRVPRGSLLQGRVRSEIATAERSRLSPEAFGAAVLQSLALLVPYDDARIFGVDPGSLLLNRLISASESDGPFRAYWLRHLYLSHLGEAYFGPHELMRTCLSSTTTASQLPDERTPGTLSMQRR